MNLSNSVKYLAIILLLLFPGLPGSDAHADVTGPLGGGVIRRGTVETRLWGPVFGVRVSPMRNSFGEIQQGFTTEEGAYVVRYQLPPCYGMNLVYPNRITAEFYYSNFNPKLELLYKPIKKDMGFFCLWKG